MSRVDKTDAPTVWPAIYKRLRTISFDLSQAADSLESSPKRQVKMSKVPVFGDIGKVAGGEPGSSSALLRF